MNPIKFLPIFNKKNVCKHGNEKNTCKFCTKTYFCYPLACQNCSKMNKICTHVSRK